MQPLATYSKTYSSLSLCLFKVLHQSFQDKSYMGTTNMVHAYGCLLITYNPPFILFIKIFYIKILYQSLDVVRAIHKLHTSFFYLDMFSDKSLIMDFKSIPSFRVMQSIFWLHFLKQVNIELILFIYLYFVSFIWWRANLGMWQAIFLNDTNAIA